VIREHHAAAERERRLSPPVVAALHDAGLLRMCTPRSLGGLDVDPLTRALVIEEISGRGATVVIAGQFGRPRQAAPAQGGDRLTGRAPFVSNGYDANWIATEALVMAGDHSRAADKGEPAVVMASLPRDSCHVIATWSVMGRRGTGRQVVAGTDVFGPTARTCPFVPEFTPGSPYQGPLSRFPFLGLAASNLPPLLLAVARRALEEVSARAQGQVPVAASTVLRNGPRRQPSWPRRRRSSARVACSCTIP
jgi:indole-3-acetate monooxygenase